MFRFYSLEHQLHSKGVQSPSCVTTFSHGPVSQHLAMTLTSPAMAAPISGRGSSVSRDSWLTAPCSRQQLLVGTSHIDTVSTTLGLHASKTQYCSCPLLALFQVQTNLASEELANDLSKEASHGQPACDLDSLQQSDNDGRQSSVNNYSISTRRSGTIFDPAAKFSDPYL